MRYIKEVGETGNYLFPSILRNFPLISGIIACAIAQAIKVITYWYKEKKWDARQLITSGGMPSSHSATVTALAITIGIQQGFGSSTFALASILACVVMYDASGIRLHAGKQAAVLNQIVFELPEGHRLSDTKPLRELLGHTLSQVVAGGLLGIVIGICVCLIDRSSGWTYDN